LEVDAATPRVEALKEQVAKLSDKPETTDEQSEQIEKLETNLEEKWTSLKDCISDREKNLSENEILQDLLFDADNAEQWLTERELIVERPIKAEDDCEGLLRRHIGLEQAVNDFSAVIIDLVTRTKQINHHQATERLSQLERQYARLKSLIYDRREKLEELVVLTEFRRFLDELERWIREKEIIASSEDTGDKLEETMILIEKWDSFCVETKRLGTEKMSQAKSEAEKIIQSGHSHSHKVETWRKTIEEMWDDLVELMETRKQMLQSTYRRHKFEVDSKEILNRLEEKEKSLQDSKDPNQLIFEIETLKDKVDAIKKEANDLEQGYGGDKKQEINDIKDAVDAAYNNILAKSKEKLKENEFNNDKERFNTIARELTQWCNAIMKRLYAIETPRDVNACEKSIATIHAIENTLA
jgi:spectrin beta